MSLVIQNSTQLSSDTEGKVLSNKEPNLWVWMRHEFCMAVEG